MHLYMPEGKLRKTGEFPLASVAVAARRHFPRARWVGATLNFGCYGSGIKFALLYAKRINPFGVFMFRSISAIPPALLVIFALSACNSSAREPASTDSPAVKTPPSAEIGPNPEFRAHVKKDAVAEYRVRTENSLNEMYFSVRLYETPETMKYLAKCEFEGLTGEDTVKFPDMGTAPHPVLQKGPEKYSCIIGFQDSDGNFRELKKVYVTDKGQELKITTLKRYY
jgi:hypothetical protein